MSGFWIITNINKSHETNHKVYSKQWLHNMEKGAKVIVLLELLEVINRKGQCIE